MGVSAPTFRTSPAVVRIDLPALRRNLAAALAGRSGDDLWLDLRRDAWGHGLERVAAEAARAGLGVIVDAGARTRVGALRAVETPRAGRTTLDPAEVFGFDEMAHPVMHLHGVVLEVKALRAGEGVSYGYTHRAPMDTTVALVAGGYAQGVPRELGNQMDVAVSARTTPAAPATKAAIVGRVAMDACVVEVGATPCAAGDDVVFFGDRRCGHPTLAQWVRTTGMAAGELTSAAGARATREFRA